MICMKYGSCLLLLATPEDPLAVTKIPIIAEAGYDYAEVSLARIYSLPEREVGEYRDAFDRHGLPVEVFNNAMPRGLTLIGPNSDQTANAAYISRAVLLAQRMGVRLITMSGPNQRSVPPEFLWREGFPQYVEFLKRFSDAAGAAGIELAIEPINDEEHGFIATVSEARRAVDAAECKNVNLIVDTYHFRKQNDSMEDAVKAVRDGKLVHIHHATREKRVYPQEWDREESKAVLLPLLDAGYRGRISIEAYAGAAAQELPAANRLLRALTPV